MALPTIPSDKDGGDTPNSRSLDCKWSKPRRSDHQGFRCGPNPQRASEDVTMFSLADVTSSRKKVGARRALKLLAQKKPPLVGISDSDCSQSDDDTQALHTLAY